MSVNEVPGTTAPTAATMAPPPATTPASTPVLGGVLAPASVDQTSLTNSLGGPVISTLPPNLQLQTLQSALQGAKPGSLLSGPSFEVPQVPIFAPAMAMSSPFSMDSLSGALPGITSWP